MSVFFRILDFFKFIFALLLDTCIFDLVHYVDAIFHLPWLLTAYGNIFLNLSDARETANCSYTGITHILISRCCLTAVNIGNV